jgi:hypothetical protein
MIFNLLFLLYFLVGTTIGSYFFFKNYDEIDFYQLTQTTTACIILWPLIVLYVGFEKISRILRKN